ncbi:probable LRR receptor-like serine/threonine-protein kinase At1g05700 [Zingiber officinale]|uniref:probable LRR receptor-like serine/threonine-protein kinase At1g05700 n=1 Tax=Zingiber officinale TaxID=94328 RepID=UPI001C4D9F6B|nr:probable LRR receptor-like serine/threonine-protein kinase At1g05700 [Zingiber officinale]
MHSMGSNARIFFLFYSPKMLFWLFLLLEIIAIAKVHSQPSTQGFISIDCGSSTNYTDATTGIPYVTDDLFTDDGVNFHVAAGYGSSPLGEQMTTLRSFPNAIRSCYALKPVIKSGKYLLRGTFMYGNYDGQNRVNTENPLQFDLYFDANFWQTVYITDPSYTVWYEVLAVATAESVSVCLVNTGTGTPFISMLEFRPLPDVMYPAVNTTQYLITCLRLNIGPSSDSAYVRYPQDPYDRLWKPWTAPDDALTEITTDVSIVSSTDDYFQPPSIVMQSAGILSYNSTVMEFSWYSYYFGLGVRNEYVNFFFSELMPNVTRSFNIYLNDGLWYSNCTPPYLSPYYTHHTGPNAPSEEYNWVFNSSGLSNLPPIINAEEVYTAIQVNPLVTDSDDAYVINAIKELYLVKRSWIGDPCVPQQYPWDGLNCSYGTNPARITSINLSSSALAGSLSTSFAMFAAIKCLDLSYNNLTGPIPDALGALPSLQILNLTGNNLTGTIPSSLFQKQNLTFSYGGNPNLCPGGTSCGGETKKKHSGVAIIVIICAASMVLLIVVTFIVWSVIKKRGSSRTTYPEQNVVQPMKENNAQENCLPIENRVFTYKELEIMTNNFRKQLGKGGFGPVFHGNLQNNVQVAVKMLSQSSSQGKKEFHAEVENLTRIHHKNLVPLIGYCMEGDDLALVYEYMPQGTLQDHLTGKIHSDVTDSWAQRLKITIGAAQGLEYLHSACDPPLIHRDVKSSNILLSASLEAKVADFGLSKSFDMDNRTHISNVSAVVGTPGYLDPEYYSSHRLSDKSDVYGFGVIILELVTGQLPVVRSMKDIINLVEWVFQRLAGGDIENIVDRNLRMGYDINSIWKAVDLAMRCTELNHHQRPTMAHVVKELNESLELECAYSKGITARRKQTGTTSGALRVEPPQFIPPVAR